MDHLLLCFSNAVFSADGALGRTECPRNKFVNAFKITILKSPDCEILKSKTHALFFMFKLLASKTS